MIETAFKRMLTEGFQTHMFMNNKNNHSVNELLYVLQNHIDFNEEDFNISIQYEDDTWGPCIPTLKAFINVQTRGITFEDNNIEFEVEIVDDQFYNCITIRKAKKFTNK